MRRVTSLLVLAGIGVSACAVPPPPVVVVAPASAVADTTAPRVLPRASVLAASLDLDAVTRALRRFIVPVLPRHLGLGGNALDVPRGFDRSRPITLAISAPSAEARRAIEALRALVPAIEPKATPGAVSVDKVNELIAAVPAAITMRVLVPAVDVVEARRGIVFILEDVHCSSEDGAVWTSGDVSVALHAAAGAILVDVAVGTGATAALAALRGLPADAPHDEPPALEGRTLRIDYVPARMADLSFLANVALTVRAVSAPGLRADDKARIVARGLWDAAGAYALAGSSRGSYFDRVDLSLRVGARTLEGVIAAETGPGFVGPGEEAWQPSTTIDVRDGKGVIEFAAAFVSTWPAPGDNPDRDLVETIKEAGWGGSLLGLPQLLPWAGRALLRERARQLGVTERRLSFERFGLLSPVSLGAEVFFGLFPETTSRADAECALADKTPCSGSSKLTLGGVTQVGSRAVRLVSVAGRFVLFAGEKASVGITAGTRNAGPLVIDVPLRALIDELRGELELGPAESALPDHLLGSVHREGKSIVFRIATP